VLERLAEGRERLGEQLEVKIGQIRDVQLAGFTPAEALYSLDAFRCHGQNAPGIDEERPPFLRQGHLTLRAVQETDAELLLQVVDLARERGLG
jgi:hypothetical protein